MQRIGGVRHRLDRFQESFDVVARHLGNAQSQMREAGNRLARVDAAIEELPGEDETGSAVAIPESPVVQPSKPALDN